MRIRTVKPEFWIDEDIASLSESACLLAIGLLNYSDDEGYFNANPALIKAAIFPLREPSKTVPSLMQELIHIGYITLYQGEQGRQYGYVNNFNKHQRVDKPKPSAIKDLCNQQDESTTILGTIQDESKNNLGRINAGKEGKGKEREGERKGTYTRTSALDDGFESFWQAYPKKTGKGAARKAWEKARPDIQQVQAALSWQIESEAWTKEHGQFIPNPATYINQERWTDEPPKIAMTKLTKFGQRALAVGEAWLANGESNGQ